LIPHKVTFFRFEIDGYLLSAVWHYSEKVVEVFELLTGIGFKIDERGIVKPQFDWKETTEHRIAVAKFLETTNLYDLLKPDDLSGLTYEHTKEEERQILQDIHDKEILKDTEYEYKKGDFMGNQNEQTKIKYGKVRAFK